MPKKFLTHQEVRELATKAGIIALPSAGPNVPPENPTYKFPANLVNDMIVFWLTKQPAMRLLGYQGAGKTDLVTQWHAALRYPLFKVVLDGAAEAADILGKAKITSQGIVATPGPGVLAAELGASLLIDEYNVARADAITGLNGLMERSPQWVDALDRLVIPKPNCRFFGACNPNDVAAGFMGRKTQDAAANDRFGMTLWVDYPDSEIEIPIVEEIIGRYNVMDAANASAFAARFVTVANNVRKEFMGNSSKSDALEVTISTRRLIAWATTFAVACLTDNQTPVTYSLERAILNELPKDSSSRQAIADFVSTSFGANA